MSGEVMHIISDEEYRAYIELTKVVRDFFTVLDHGVRLNEGDLVPMRERFNEAVIAHNKRLNSLRRAQGT